MNIRAALKRKALLITYVRQLRDRINLFLFDDLSFKVKKYHKTHGRTPNLENPQSYTEKMLWSSENYRDNRFVWYADKYLVREHVKRIIGEQFLIPLYDVVDNARQLDFEKYPNRFVLNATHGSNMVMLCNDKADFDEKKAKAVVKMWLRSNYYYSFREWHYKYIKPRVIVMQNIASPDGTPPWDYKFFCFNGKPVIVSLDLERFGNISKRNIYDMEWNQMKDIRVSRPQDFTKTYPKPQNFDLMKELAEKLSKEFEHVRVDFYNIDGKIYFGELTFLHAAAGVVGNITPWEFDLKLGEYYQLPPRNIEGWKYAGESSMNE